MPIALSLIAAAGKIRQTLGWQPQLDDLDTIVTQALAWETRLGEMAKAG